MEKCAPYYLGAGIDIYVYDSSDDDDTKHVLDKWKGENKENVYYVRMPSELHANMKVYKIWQFYGLKKQYDFVWMSGDALQLSRRAIESIMVNLKPEYDMVELDVFDEDEIGVRVYEQPDRLFAENAWKTTLFGVMILNAQTFLSGIDWNYYEAKYSQPRLIHYSHVSLYFSRAVQLSDFRCMHLPLAREHTGSEYKKESSWKKDTFAVICEGRVTTIKKMPAYYSNRRKVMLDLGINSVFRDQCNFLDLRREGIYSLNVFLRYFLTWGRVCNVGYWELFWIAFSYKVGKRHINQTFVSKLRKMRKRYKFLFLYGAGIVGERYGKYLSQNGLEYEGYLVTKVSGNKEKLNDHKIMEIKDLDNIGKFGIIVAVSDKLSEEVLMQLQECGYGRQVYYSSELSGWIRYTDQL